MYSLVLRLSPPVNEKLLQATESLAGPGNEYSKCTSKTLPDVN